MTQFAQPTFNIPSMPNPKAMGWAIDSAIAQNRATTPQSVTDQRTEPRLSIAELNEQSMDALSERFGRQLDRRPPVVKALDVIDLPRNVIANVLFQGTAKQKAFEGDRATFGLPRVNFSDALESMGVKSGVVRGLVGFVGDVALDPLTYVSGGGAAGLKLAGVGGGRVVISKTGKKAFDAAINQVAQAKTVNAVADEGIRRYFQLSGLDDAFVAAAQQGDDALGRSVEQRIRDAMRAEFYGTVNRPRAAGVLRLAGFDTRATGGRLAESIFQRVDDATPQSVLDARQAAQDLVLRFQRGSTQLPGVNLGLQGADVGSEVLRIPFTDVALRTRPFTSGAREAAAAAVMARSGVAAPKVTEAIQAAQAGVEAATTGAKRINEILDELGSIRSAADELADVPLGDRVAQDIATNNFANVASDFAMKGARIDELRAIEQAVKANTDGILARVTGLTEQLQAVDPNAITPEIATANMLLRDKALAELAITRESLKQAQALMQGAKPLRTRTLEDLAATAAAAVNDGLAGGLVDDLYVQYGDELDLIADSLIGLDQAEDAARATYVDALTGRIRALEALAEAARQPVMAMLNADERVMVDIASRMLGTDSAGQGLMILQPIYRAVADRLGDEHKVSRAIHNAGVTLRNAFGDRGGQLHQMARRQKAINNQAAVELAQREGRQWRDHIRATVQNDIPPGALKENFTEIDSLISAFQVERLNEQFPNGGYNVYKFDPDDIDGILRDEAGNPVLMEWASLLQTARRDGLLSQNAYPGLEQKLRQLADEGIERYRQVGGAAGEDFEMLVREVYLPNIISREFDQHIRRMRTAGPDARGGGRAREEIVESFMIPRTSDEVRFPMVDAEGNTRWARFYGWQEMYTTSRQYDEANLAAIYGRDSDTFNRIQRTKDIIKQYDAMPDEFKLQYPPRPTSPHDLARLAADELHMLSNGADFKGSAFETGSSVMLGERLAQQLRATANRGMMDVAASAGAKVIPDRLWTAKKGDVGAELIVGGVKAKIVPGTDAAAAALQVGNQRFRPLNTALIRGDAAILARGMFDENIRDGFVMLYPERAAEQIERIFAAFSGPGRMAGFLRVLDNVTAAWKATTLGHPSWTVGNVGSDGILGFAAGANARTFARSVMQGFRLSFARGRDALLGKPIMLGGQPMTYQDAISEMLEHGVSGANYTTKELDTLTAEGIVNLVDPRPFSRQGIADRWIDSERIITESETLRKLPAGIQKLLAAPVVATKQVLSMYGAWFKLNAMISDGMRMGTYIDLRNQGMSPTEAANRVLDNMFDYNDLTWFESNVMRRMLPFYTWLRNSLGHQVKFAVDHPWYAGIVPKLKEAFEEATLGDAAVPEHRRPSWLREQLAIQIGKDPDGRFAFTIGSLLPHEQLYRTIAAFMGPQGLQDYLNYVASGINPAVRTPLELSLGREFFSDRRIGPDAMSGDISMLEHVFNQVRPLRELFNPASARTASVPAAFERSIGEGFARAIIGGRVQPFNEGRIDFNNQRELQEQIADIRRAINIAIREGNVNAGFNARLRLMQTYDAAMRLGLEDMVPIWAREQLNRLRGVSVYPTEPEAPAILEDQLLLQS